MTRNVGEPHFWVNPNIPFAMVEKELERAERLIADATRARDGWLAELERRRGFGIDRWVEGTWGLGGTRVLGLLS